MANEENLIPNSERTPSELREMTRKGGIASGVARRRKKAMKEQVEYLLSLPLTNKNVIEQLKKLGVDTDNMDNQMAMIVGMWNSAVKGNSKSFNALMGVTGELVTNINVNTVTDDKVAELQEMIENE